MARIVKVKIALVFFFFFLAGDDNTNIGKENSGFYSDFGSIPIFAS